jgi:hypothetical protein
MSGFVKTTIASVAVWAAVTGVASADVSNGNGMIFRAIGIFQGQVEEGRCRVPVMNQAIGDNAGAVCLTGTEFVFPDGSVSVEPTYQYPMFGPEFINFCGGFIALQNNMINQAVNVRKIRIRYRIPGLGFPVLCRSQRSHKLFTGQRVDPINSINSNPFGQINVVFTQMLPIYSQQFLDCLRDPLRGDIQTPVTVVAKIRAFGHLDDGRDIKSNRVQYSLTLLGDGAVPPGPNGGSPPAGTPVRCATPVP